MFHRSYSQMGFSNEIRWTISGDISAEAGLELRRSIQEKCAQNRVEHAILKSSSCSSCRAAFNFMQNFEPSPKAQPNCIQSKSRVKCHEKSHRNLIHLWGHFGVLTRFDIFLTSRIQQSSTLLKNPWQSLHFAIWQEAQILHWMFCFSGIKEMEFRTKALDYKDAMKMNEFARTLRSYCII